MTTAKRSTIARSDAVANKVLQLRHSPPTVIYEDEVTFLGEKIFPPSKIGDLMVCEVGRYPGGYQRLRVTRQVNELILAMKMGGQVLDPITVSLRSGQYWIVDGQQRMWAHLEVGRPLKARVYRCETIEGEARLFRALNNTAKISPDIYVGGDPGVIGRTLREVNDDEGSPFYRMIAFKHHGRLFAATSLARALCMVMTGVRRYGKIENVLNTAETHLKRDPSVVGWTRRFLDLVGIIYIPNMKRYTHNRHPIAAKSLGLQALAIVAHQRWTRRGVSLPTRRQASALARVLQDPNTPQNTKYLPTVVAEVNRCWPE